MARKVVIFFTLIIFAVALTFGIVKRQTYTDITHEEDFVEKINVAQMPYNMASIALDGLDEIFADSEYILRVRVTGEIEHRFQCDRQEVVVTKVYAGDGIDTDSKMYLYSDRWQTDCDSEPYAMERGFVNVMDKDKEYLVCVESLGRDSQSGDIIAKVYGDYYITPVFCYEDKENVIMPMTADESNYICYKDVMNNEFFVDSQETLELIETLKNSMIERYN